MHSGTHLCLVFYRKGKENDLASFVFPKNIAHLSHSSSSGLTYPERAARDYLALEEAATRNTYAPMIYYISLLLLFSHAGEFIVVFNPRAAGNYRLCQSGKVFGRKMLAICSEPNDMEWCVGKAFDFETEKWIER